MLLIRLILCTILILKSQIHVLIRLITHNTYICITQLILILIQPIDFIPAYRYLYLTLLNFLFLHSL